MKDRGEKKLVEGKGSGRKKGKKRRVWSELAESLGSLNFIKRGRDKGILERLL